MKNNFTRKDCLNCSKIQNTCCTFHEHYIPLTIDEIKKIESKGFKLEEFATVVAFEDEQLEEDWWKELMVKIDGINFMTCLKSNNSNMICTMLEDSKGCMLKEDRPLICKIYPFWIDKDNNVVFQDDFCHIKKNKIDVKKALNIMNESEENIHNYIESIKEDYKKNKEKHREIVKKLLYNRYYFGINDFN
jgi:Fe-S-cluster containining protein